MFLIWLVLRVHRPLSITKSCFLVSFGVSAFFFRYHLNGFSKQITPTVEFKQKENDTYSLLDRICNTAKRSYAGMYCTHFRSSLVGADSVWICSAVFSLFTDGGSTCTGWHPALANWENCLMVWIPVHTAGRMLRSGAPTVSMSTVGRHTLATFLLLVFWDAKNPSLASSYFRYAWPSTI